MRAGVRPVRAAGPRPELDRLVVPKCFDRNRPASRRAFDSRALPGRDSRPRGSRSKRPSCRRASQRSRSAQAERLYDALATRDADRHTLIIALGGGVVGDLAGFVAATFTRGLPLIMVPTTLLAQVDSSSGGKVGVNHPRAKNLIGAFYQPVGVWIDTQTLETLPDRDFRCGLAEVVKYGVISSDSFFSFLEENADANSRRETTRNRADHPAKLPDQGGRGRARRA